MQICASTLSKGRVLGGSLKEVGSEGWDCAKYLLKGDGTFQSSSCQSSSSLTGTPRVMPVNP